MMAHFIEEIIIVCRPRPIFRHRAALKYHHHAQYARGVSAGRPEASSSIAGEMLVPSSLLMHAKLTRASYHIVIGKVLNASGGVPAFIFVVSHEISTSFTAFGRNGSSCRPWPMAVCRLLRARLENRRPLFAAAAASTRAPYILAAVANRPRSKRKNDAAQNENRVLRASVSFNCLGRKQLGSGVHFYGVVVK